MTNPFGVRDSISKGSPKLGLRLIETYGKKPTKTVAQVRASAVGAKAKKAK